MVGRVLVMKNSGLGIASFIVSLATWILLFVWIIIFTTVYLEGSAWVDNASWMRSAAILWPFSLLLDTFANLVALPLGVVSLFQREKKNRFAVLGIIFSASWLAIGAILVLVSYVISMQG